MISLQSNQIALTLNQLFDDAKNDKIKVLKGFSKSIFRPIRPTDFADAYLSISRKQGVELSKLINEKQIKNIVEFGTSFGISTLFLAQGAESTNGKIITTELIASKAEKAIMNFEKAGVSDLIEVRVGDAMITLKNHDHPIDLLFLDGWKNLYLSLFNMLAPNFHSKTIIYVDNADMDESKSFLKTVSQNSKYKIQYQFAGKVALINIK
jgi:predicted O-methyltransferase YrrM